LEDGSTELIAGSKYHSALVTIQPKQVLQPAHGLSFVPPDA
jgi:hypothetical protein